MGQDNIEYLLLIRGQGIVTQVIEHVLKPAALFDPCLPGFYLD
jgi:hypothetical protein